MKLIKTIVLSIILGMSSCSSKNYTDTQSQDVRIARNLQVEHFQDVTVSIYNKFGSVGSGFIIHQDNNSAYILTARHVLNNSLNRTEFDMEPFVCPTVRIGPMCYQYNMAKGAVQVISNEDLDLAIIEISIKKIGTFKSVAEFRENDMPSVGSRVYGCGTPMGMPLIMSFGNICRYYVDGNLLKIKTTNQIVPGCSGGPIFDDSQLVIGVIQGWNEQVGFNASLSSYDVIKWIKNTKYQWIVNKN